MKKEVLIQKISQHWVSLIPDGEEDRSERWQRLLSLYPEAPEVFPDGFVQNFEGSRVHIFHGRQNRR